MRPAVAVDQRSQIFELRQQGNSQRQIAERLGISSSKVQRELRKRAPEVRAERQIADSGGSPDFATGGEVELPPPSPALSGDPLVLDARRQAEIERAELQRTELQVRRLEAQRRLALMQNPNDQGALMQLQTLEAINGVRQLLSTRAQTPPPATPAPTLVDQLSQFRQMSETMASFAPSKPPSSLEEVVAMEKLKLEDRRVNTQLEMEQRERQQRLDSERARNDAFANFLETLGPLLPQLIDRWGRPAAAASTSEEPPPASIQERNGDSNNNVVQMPPRPAPAAPNRAGEVVGVCPNCETRVGITGAAVERCPECQYELAVVEGRIRLSLGDGRFYPPVGVSEL